MKGNPSIFLQVISCNPTDSSTIEEHGGNRIQLVSALEIGGLTPSCSIIRKSLQAVSIPTHVIIRHHNNGFVLKQQEKQLLLDDVIACRDLFNVAGIVIGGLKLNGEKFEVDYEFVEMITECVSNKMNITFHKASDYVPNLSQVVPKLCSLGVSQILTQGGPDPVNSIANANNIGQIEDKQRKQHILCGGGVSRENVVQIIQSWGIERVHIGTCVRQPKYGNVDGDKLRIFRETIDKI